MRHLYDAEDRVVHTATTGWFDQARSEYDRANRVTTFRPGGDAFERLLYDEDENVLEVANALGQVVRYTYEGGYCTSETDGEGNTITYAYDAQGNVASVQAPSGRVTRYRWDVHGQIDRVIDPAGHVFAFERDDRGNLVLARAGPTMAAPSWSRPCAANRTSETHCQHLTLQCSPTSMEHPSLCRLPHHRGPTKPRHPLSPERTPRHLRPDYPMMSRHFSKMESSLAAW